MIFPDVFEPNPNATRGAGPRQHHLCRGRLDLGAGEGTKPGVLPSTLASVLFYFPDGFGGLAPENPLLPSLPMCTRVSL